ncbi:hypothetical protein HW555_012952 [Spodoptera exigua]|uniref:DDE Tnp4 domain-containing protein n=1 Tax=Spodoptera exigua TaxID=7107 RepID=A0A835G487_SPOEX|nr:hypothetical protein HW555_012952 [Spodoptera exigua]
MNNFSGIVFYATGSYQRVVGGTYGTLMSQQSVSRAIRICDADLKILSVDALFGGASHDSFVWNQHPIKQHLINLNNNGENVYLLGKYNYENSDSGYAQSEYMMTPIVDAPVGSPEEYYTKLHCSARNTVERTIGVLKNRWRCLLGHRVLHYHPDGYIRHNMCINRIGFDENIANYGYENPDANSQESINSTSAAELRQGIAKRTLERVALQFLQTAPCLHFEALELKLLTWIKVKLCNWLFSDIGFSRVGNTGKKVTLQESDSHVESETHQTSRNYYLGKDLQTRWNKIPATNPIRRRARNIVTQLPGAKGLTTKTRELYVLLWIN